MTDLSEINPQGVYSFAEAARLLPSCQPGKSVHLATLHRWRDQGKIKAHRSPGRGWYILGTELLRLLHADQAPEFVGRTPTQRNRDIDAAFEELKRLGV